MNKIQVKHAEKFGIKGATDEFYSLIDRLQEHYESKNPGKKWDNDAYYSIAIMWIGKEKELKKRVENLKQVTKK